MLFLHVLLLRLFYLNKITALMKGTTFDILVKSHLFDSCDNLYDIDAPNSKSIVENSHILPTLSCTVTHQPFK